MFTYPTKRAREIRKFHVAVVQRRQRNVRNSVCRCKFYKHIIFAVLLAVAVVVGFVVIQKYCYHGNVTSHVFSLFCITIAFDFTWDDCNTQGKLETTVIRHVPIALGTFSALFTFPAFIEHFLDFWAKFEHFFVFRATVKPFFFFYIFSLV